MQIIYFVIHKCVQCNMFCDVLNVLGTYSGELENQQQEYYSSDHQELEKHSLVSYNGGPLHRLNQLAA